MTDKFKGTIWEYCDRGQYHSWTNVRGSTHCVECGITVTNNKSPEKWTTEETEKVRKFFDDMFPGDKGKHYTIDELQIKRRQEYLKHNKSSDT